VIYELPFETRELLHPGLISPDDINRFKEVIREKNDHLFKNVPSEVKSFIDALSIKLDDFAQYGKERMMIKGSDLHLCGLKEWKGEPIFSFSWYEWEVPKIQVVENTTSMLRIYHKRGKQGLIDYCIARVKGRDLEKLLQVLNVHVFHEDRPEFIKVMNDIRESKKIDLYE
jgi:hypothetical protein